jgi:hypothetical protein
MILNRRRFTMVSCDTSFDEVDPFFHYLAITKNVNSPLMHLLKAVQGKRYAVRPDTSKPQ